MYSARLTLHSSNELPLVNETKYGDNSLHIYSVHEGRNREGKIVLIWWAEPINNGYGDIDDKLENSDEIKSYELLYENSNWRLYKSVHKTEVGLWSIATEIGFLAAHARLLRGEWILSLQFPSHESFQRALEYARDLGLNFSVESVAEQEVDITPLLHPISALLTNEQAEALLVASEVGYFETPRAASLSDVGEALGISKSAASRLIRRAHKNIANQLYRHSSDVIGE